MYFPYICLRGGPKICRKKLRSSMSSMGWTCVQPLNHSIYHEGSGKGHPNSWVSLRPEELTKYHGWSTYPTINADYISLLKKHHIKVQQGYPGNKKGHLKYNGYPPNFGKKKTKTSWIISRFAVSQGLSTALRPGFWTRPSCPLPKNVDDVEPHKL